MIEDKDHPEYYCNDCGNPNVTWYAPNELWNKLCDRNEIICPKCFQERADKENINIIFTTEIIKKTNYESTNKKPKESIIKKI